MEPTGSVNPTVLIIGEAPGRNEDERGKQFVGKSGQLLRSFIPEQYKDIEIRWNNAVNCRPPSNRTPETIELNCCYPRLERDVLKTKPIAIFGFGAVPLFQIVNPDSKYRSISLWRGRKLPVNIGGHVCWYFPIHHPSYILHLSKDFKRSEGYGSDEKFAFACDVRNAFSQLDSLLEPVIHTVEEAKADIEIVDDINRVAELLELAGSEPTCGVDLETNALRPYVEGAKILSMSCSSKRTTFAFAVDHPQAAWTKLERRQLDVLIKRFLNESRCRKIVHHLPFELEWFGYFYGTTCFYASRWEDSESQAYILDPRRGGLSLDYLCLIRFGINLKAISGLDRKNLEKSPIHQVLSYNAIDSRYHRALYLVQRELIKREGMQEVYEHQLRRIPSLVLATMHGVPIDQVVVKQFEEKYGDRLKQALIDAENDESAKRFVKLKGRQFNPLSPRDVGILLKEVLKQEAASTSKLELEHIDHPIAEKIVACREAQKVLSTYILPVSVNSEDSVLFPDGMIHPIISTTVVITWRSASAEPNIQNWPKRDEERKEVRSQIRHKDANMRIVSFDYAGIQARNVAMESRDKALVEAYWNNYDIHTTWMEKINKIYPNWIPKKADKETIKAYRYQAKNKFVFPSFFGAQPYSISANLNIPKEKIQALQEAFFDQFHDIAQWHKEIEKFYFKNGYVTGLSGFRRYAPVSINELINTPIQSDESIIVMDAMARLSEMEDPRYQAMLMVHDDLTFLWPKNEIERRAEVVIREMITSPFEWTKIVPLEVEMSVGKDWIEMSDAGKYANNSWNGIVELKN